MRALSGSVLAILFALSGTACEAVAGLDQYCVAETLAPADPACRLVADQCGCEDGLACQLDFNDGSRFCAPEGFLPPGAPCTVGASNPCEAGAVCVGLTQSGSGACYAFCGESDDCSDVGSNSTCSLVPSLFTGVCEIPCTPRTREDDCGPNTTCAAAGSSGLCSFTGTLRAGDPCEDDATGAGFDRFCAVDLVCLLTVDGIDKCFPQCGPGLPACSADTTCQRVGISEPVGSGEYGVCSL